MSEKMVPVKVYLKGTIVANIPWSVQTDSAKAK